MIIFWLYFSDCRILLMLGFIECGLKIIVPRNGVLARDLVKARVNESINFFNCSKLLKYMQFGSSLLVFYGFKQRYKVFEFSICDI